MYDIINAGWSLRVGVGSRSKEIELQHKGFRGRRSSNAMQEWWPAASSSFLVEKLRPHA